MVIKTVNPSWEKSSTWTEGIETKECSEEDLVEAIRFGHEAIKLQCKAQNELAAICGKEKREIVLPEGDEELHAQVAEMVSDKIYEVVKDCVSPLQNKAQP